MDMTSFGKYKTTLANKMLLNQKGVLPGADYNAVDLL